MIILSKNNIVYNNDYDKSSDKYLEKNIDSLVPYLGDVVCINGPFTLENLFKILIKDRDLYEKMFAWEMGKYNMQTYIDSLVRESQEKSDLDIEYIEFKWFCEITPLEGYDDDLEIGCCVHGIQKNDDIPQSVGCHDLYDLKDYNLVINENVEITDWRDYNFNRDPKYKKNTIFKGNKRFTIYEILSTLFEELLFYGIPVRKETIIGENIKIEKGNT